MSERICQACASRWILRIMSNEVRLAIIRSHPRQACRRPPPAGRTPVLRLAELHRAGKPPRAERAQSGAWILALLPDPCPWIQSVLQFFRRQCMILRSMPAGMVNGLRLFYRESRLFWFSGVYSESAVPSFYHFGFPIKTFGNDIALVLVLSSQYALSRNLSNKL